MSHRKAFTVPGIPGSTSPQVFISGTSLLWLPNHRANNTIESWTLQFVGEFTRALEMEHTGLNEELTRKFSLRATLNKIEFARAFFPHLYKRDSKVLGQIARKAMSELRKLEPEEVA